MSAEAVGAARGGPSSRPEPLLVAVLFGLTAVTGLVDAVSFLALGRVFTANMTGNVVFLGFAAAGAPGLSAIRSTTALVAFFAGAALGGRMAARLQPGPLHRWTGAAFALEAVLLFAAAAAAVGGGSELTSAAPRAAVIVLTGLAMGVRNATVRKLAVPDLTTTVLTLTITGLGAESRLAGGTSPNRARRASSVVAMLAGAAIGAGLLAHSVALVLAVGGATSGACAAFAYFGLPRAAEPA